MKSTRSQWALTVLAILALSIPTVTQAFAQTTDTKQAVLSIEPKDGSFQVGDTISTTVTLNTNAVETDEADIVIDYDPTVLEVVDQDSTKEGVQISDGDLYEITMANEVDTTKGEITYKRTALAPASYYTTQSGAPAGTLAKISFKALAAGTADVRFAIADAGKTSETRVVSIDKDVLKTANNASFTITAAQAPASGTTPSSILMNSNVTTLHADGTSTAQVVVTVLDSEGSSKANVPVTVVVSKGDATIATSGSATDANGQLTVTLTASKNPGTETISASLTSNPSVTSTLDITQDTASALQSAPATPAPAPLPDKLTSSGPENMNALFALFGVFLLGYVAHVRKNRFATK